MRAVPSRAERSEGRSFPRHCIIPVATARVPSPGTRTVTVDREWVSVPSGRGADRPAASHGTPRRRSSGHLGSSPPQIGRASTGCRNGYAPSVMRFAPRPTPSCSNIPADIPSTPAPRPQPSSHSDPARHRPHRNPVRYVLHQRTTVRDWRMPRSATLRWGRPAGPTSALPIQTSAGGYGVNYDSPEAAPATKSGFGPPRLPQWTTDTSSAMACARPVARRRLRRGVPRASRVWKSAAPSTGPGMQPARLPGKIYGGANVDTKPRSAQASTC